MEIQKNISFDQILSQLIDSDEIVYAFAVDTKGKLIYFNKAYRDFIYRFRQIELEHIENYIDVIEKPEYKKVFWKYIKKCLKGNEFTIEQKLVYDPEVDYFRIRWIPLMENGEVIGALSIGSNITELKLLEERQINYEHRYENLVKYMLYGLALYQVKAEGKEYSFYYLDCNPSYQTLLGVKKENIIGKEIREVIKEVEFFWFDAFIKVIEGKSNYEILEDYSAFYSRYYRSIIYSPAPMQLAVMIEDITESKTVENRLKDSTVTDFLTKLYNRRYFDEYQMDFNRSEHYPLGVFVVDVNHLKKVNDTYGHKIGDQLIVSVANILKEFIRGKGLVIRWGGDEFLILLYRANSASCEVLKEMITKELQKIEIQDEPISVAIGYTIKKIKATDFISSFKQAEDRMMEHKKSNVNRTNGTLVDALLKVLWHKNNDEYRHSQRVALIAKRMAMELGLSKDELSILDMASMLHDIGKVLIDNQVLTKKEQLVELEEQLLYSHPQIGHDLLDSIFSSSKLSEIILQHHERYDGTGYPKGLKGEEIMIEARIIHLAETFDALTRSTYQTSLDYPEAIKIIQSESGKQFDPNLVDLFINQILYQFENESSENL